MPSAVISTPCLGHHKGLASPRAPLWATSLQKRDKLGHQHTTVAAIKGHTSCFRLNTFSAALVPQVVCKASLAADNDPGRGQTLRTVVLPTALVLLLCNMDRICMSVAMPAIAREMSWAPGTQGIVQSAFLWGYTITQILGGSLADRHGGHRVIAAAIAWFSLSSLLLPAAVSRQAIQAGWVLPAVLACRALVGLGEGVVMPSMNTLMATRVPATWRSSALGIVYSGFHAGNLAGLALSPLLLVKYGWRSIFYVFGALGLPLLAVWHLAGRAQSQSQAGLATSKQPSEDGTKTVIRIQAQAGSGASSAPGPLSTQELLSQSATWAIIVANTVNHWGYFIYLSWMPSYFLEVHALNLRSSAGLAFIPWLVMAIGSSLSGLVADRWLAGGASVATVRKTFQAIAFAVPAVMLLVLAQPQLSLNRAVLCMTLALGGTSLGQAGFVANISDIAPRHAGQLFGLCNTFGCLAAIAGVSTVGFVIQATGSFAAVFQLTAGLYALGVVAWLSLCRGQPVFD